MILMYKKEAKELEFFRHKEEKNKNNTLLSNSYAGNQALSNNKEQNTNTTNNPTINFALNIS